MEDLVMGFEMGTNDVNVCVPVLLKKKNEHQCTK
jgi:hypothetical protein